jgi:ketosteroid isomerase-like protein
VGREAIYQFIVDTQTMVKRESLVIHDILASDERSVILGHLQTRISATGKLIDSAFAIILKFRDQQISDFLMLEDSYATSKAAR